MHIVLTQWDIIEVNGLPEDFYQQTLDGVKKTTAEDIARIAEQHIDLDKLTIVVVGDAQEVRKDLEKIAPVTLVELTDSRAPEVAAEPARIVTGNRCFSRRSPKRADAPAPSGSVSFPARGQG